MASLAIASRGTHACLGRRVHCGMTQKRRLSEIGAKESPSEVAKEPGQNQLREVVRSIRLPAVSIALFNLCTAGVLRSAVTGLSTAGDTLEGPFRLLGIFGANTEKTRLVALTNRQGISGPHYADLLKPRSSAAQDATPAGGSRLSDNFDPSLFYTH